MSGERAVVMSAEQAQVLEEVGVELMRHKDERAMKLLTISLAYKFARPIDPQVPDNVVELHGWSRRVV